jgi:hypothetical protein
MLASPDSSTVQGCPLLIPETAFLEDGRVVEVFKIDPKEKYIVRQKIDGKNGNNGLQEIRTAFCNIVRERRKEFHNDVIDNSSATIEEVKPRLRADTQNSSSI